MTSADGSDRGRWPALVGRALLYALAIVVLVLYGSGQDYVFIYQGF
jgi:hypothetical protein